MGEIDELYQELILDHSKRPHNFRILPGADRAARGHNPLCGDNITVFVRLDADRVAEVTFQGSGCAICTASASVMTEATSGRTGKEIATLFERFHEMVTGDPTAPRDSEGMGKLAAFAGVSEFPVRVKCASLPWHTLNAALKGETDPVSTE